MLATATLIVNGMERRCATAQNLLAYLRDELRLTSVKRGCAEGACGSCMVLAEGKAIRACLLSTEQLDGKRVMTVEGISNYEQEVYARAFADAGAVQCGFCIPGMVISAKGLLDAVPEPTPQQLKEALRDNVCRCTGYVKIEAAIMQAAKVLREKTMRASGRGGCRIGERMPRLDARAKVLGIGQYVDDMQLPGMLHGAVLRAPRPRALITGIAIEEARRQPGVAKVLTAADIPGERFQGLLIRDWPALVAVGEETRYVGDALVLIAAKTREQAKAALRFVRVDYEERKPVTTPQDALAENAPKLQPNGNVLAKSVVRRGAVDAALAAAAQVVDYTFHTPPTEHAFLEPESALAVPEADGTMTVYSGSQSVYTDQKGISSVLGVPGERVNVVGKLVGGAFGGKDDLAVQHHAALLAWHAGLPVKLTLDRQESLCVHPKRHAMKMQYTVACDAQGMLTALRARLTADGGAYASSGGVVLQSACSHAAGPYKIENVDIAGVSVYTNNPPGGSFRGGGVAQTCFALESCINMLAEKVGITPWQIRFQNAVAAGDALPSGAIADPGTGLKQTLLAVKEICEQRPAAGIACALKQAGSGVELADVGRVAIRIEQERAVIYTSAACSGQGLATTLLQIVAETTGLPAERLFVATPDTLRTPDGGATTASRQTMCNGEASRLAALDLKQDLERGESLAELEGRQYYREYAGNGDLKATEQNNSRSCLGYGYATQVALLDAAGRVETIIAAHDVGRAINPTNVEGQIEGGVVMGLGYALTEDYPLQDSEPTATFGTLGLWRAGQVPHIECIVVEANSAGPAYGAKGVGEIVTIPTAPAVAGAYFRRDGIFRTQLPLAATAYNRQQEKAVAARTE